MSISGEVYRAVDRLYNTQEFKTILKYISECKNEEMLKAVKTPGNVDVIRGRAQVFIELEALFLNSTILVERLEKRNAKQNYTGHTAGY